MNLLVIVSILGLAQSLEHSDFQDIDKLIIFIKGAGNRLSEAADELDGIKIDGKNKYAEVIDEYLLKVPHTDKDGEKYKKLKDLVEMIDKAWNNLGTKDPGDNDKTQLAAAGDTRDKLYDAYVNNGDTNGLPYQIANAEQPYLCERTIPDQLRLLKVHQAAILSELRAFILGLKAGDDNQKAVAKAVLNSEEYILASKQGFYETDDRHRACDPPEHIRDETFGEFLGLFQGVVVSDGHTNAGDGSGDCSSSCNALDESRIDKCYKRRTVYGSESHCHSKKCNGRLFNCIHVMSVRTCELDPKSDRRFTWAFSPGRGKVYGKEGSCEGKEVNIVEGGVLGSGKCYTCLCTCAEEDPPTKAIRSVSLLPQFANIKDNKVVTGIRFQLQDKMFHVQIEESKMGRLGQIVPDTSEWKKLDSVSYDAKTGSFKMRNGLRNVDLYEDFDYKNFNRDTRGVNLDLVKTPTGEVIVGVSLRYNQNDDAVEIQILSWPFDPDTGELVDPIDLEDPDVAHDWITWENSPRRSENYENQRFTIGLERLDVPTLAPKNRVLSDPNDRINLKSTGYDVDLGQHTIPYVTLQDVTFSDKKTALRALELYYARAKGYGGFLGFRIFGYDFINLFQGKMSQDDVDKYTADYDGELAKEIPIKD